MQYGGLMYVMFLITFLPVIFEVIVMLQWSHAISMEEDGAPSTMHKYNMYRTYTVKGCGK